MRVEVRDNNVDKAMKLLKRKMQNEGILREMRSRERFEKPSIRRAREHRQAISRARKAEAKRIERDGF